MTDQPRTGRRHLLTILAALPASARAGRSLAAPAPAVTAAPFPESPRLLVAGPSDGTLNKWADALLPALEQSLPPETAIRRVESTGMFGNGVGSTTCTSLSPRRMVSFAVTFVAPPAGAERFASTTGRGSAWAVL